MNDLPAPSSPRLPARSAAPRPEERKVVGVKYTPTSPTIDCDRAPWCFGVAKRWWWTTNRWNRGHGQRADHHAQGRRNFGPHLAQGRARDLARAEEEQRREADALAFGPRPSPRVAPAHQGVSVDVRPRRRTVPWSLSRRKNASTFAICAATCRPACTPALKWRQTGRSARSASSGGHRVVRPRAVVLDFPAALRAGVDPDGQESAPGAATPPKWRASAGASKLPDVLGRASTWKPGKGLPGWETGAQPDGVGRVTTSMCGPARCGFRFPDRPSATFQCGRIMALDGHATPTPGQCPWGRRRVVDSSTLRAAENERSGEEPEPEPK